MPTTAKGTTVAAEVATRGMALMSSVTGCHGEMTACVLMWMDSGADPRVGCPRRMKQGHHLVEGERAPDRCEKGTLWDRKRYTYW